MDPFPVDIIREVLTGSISQKTSSKTKNRLETLWTGLTTLPLLTDSFQRLGTIMSSNRIQRSSSTPGLKGNELLMVRETKSKHLEERQITFGITNVPNEKDILKTLVGDQSIVLKMRDRFNAPKLFE